MKVNLVWSHLSQSQAFLSKLVATLRILLQANKIFISV